MIDTTTRISGLSDSDLIAMHKKLDEEGFGDSATVTIHHIAATEMLKRNLDHGHTDDEWVDTVLLIEEISVDSSDEIEAPEGFEKAFDSALAKGGTISVLLTTNGYVLKADPTVSDVHVDALLTGGKKKTDFDKVDVGQGSFVSWNSSGGRSQGKVKSVNRSGKVKVPDSSFTINGNEEDPALLIRVWRKTSSGWEETETVVGHKMSSVTSIEPLTKEVESEFGKAAKCPIATSNVEVNLKNRGEAISVAAYGPLNPSQRNSSFWSKKASEWGVSSSEAKKSRCGNCAAFNKTDEILDCISDGVGGENSWDVIAAGDLGYCEVFDFKCASSRTCDAWITGGPVTGKKSEVKAIQKAVDTFSRFTLPDGSVYEFNVPEGSVWGSDGVSKHYQGRHDQKSHGGGGSRLSSDVVRGIIRQVGEEGGLSVSMVDGSNPPDGYMVARTKGVKPAVVDAKDFFDEKRGPKVLGSFFKDNKQQLTEGDYLGVWHEESSGKVFLDVAENVKDRDTAIRLGSPQERNQISIWDVVRGEEVNTGGTGEISKSGVENGTSTGHVEDDGRGDRRLRSGGLGDDSGEVEKHYQGQHDQKTHAGSRGIGYDVLQTRRKIGIALGDTQRPLQRNQDGQVVNPDATGGYKAGISETAVFNGKTVTPVDSLWHHLEGNPESGYKLTAERQKFHNQIVENDTKNVLKSVDPTFHMLGGGPASGKTTAIKSGLAAAPDRSKAVHINADEIKGAMPEFERLRTSSSDNDFFNAAAFAHEESSYLAKEIQKRAIKNGQDIVLDGTGDSEYRTLARKVDQAKGAGYKVNAVYATLPTDKAVEISNARSLKYAERRFVPEYVVRGIHRDISAVFPEAVRNNLFDSVKLIDTGDLFNPVLVGESVGGSFKIHDSEKWNQFLAKGNE